MNHITKISDEYGRFTLQEAIQHCQKMNKIWRLPSAQECQEIRSNMRQHTLKSMGISFDDFYWTSSVEDGFPLAYSFFEDRPYLMPETTQLFLRLVQDKFDIQNLTREELVCKMLGIIRKYIPNMDERKFRELFEEGVFVDAESELPPYRWVLIEDYNLAKKFTTDYSIYLYEDMDILDAWERCFLVDDVDFDDDLDQVRANNYIGVLDLKEEIYLRVNGQGDYYEYDEVAPMLSDGEKEVTPRWEDWLVSERI